MTFDSAVVIVGAGLAGLSSAAHLAEKLATNGLSGRVVVVDREPMGLTSAVSTGGFRNFYPDSKFMTQLCTRSISLMDGIVARTNNAIGLNRCGYVFVSSQMASLDKYKELAQRMSANGSGDVRFHDQESFSNFNEATYRSSFVDGVDIITDPRIIFRLLPRVNQNVVVMMHVRNAGYLNVKGLGEYLIQECQRLGVEFIKGTVSAIGFKENQEVKSVSVKMENADADIEIQCKSVVLAVGPNLPQFAEMVGVDFPVTNEIHAKAVFRDPLGIVPENFPFTIWSDNVNVSWTENEVTSIAAQKPQEKWEFLTKEVLGGVHMRPMTTSEHHYEPGVKKFVGIWTFDITQIPGNPVFPIPFLKRQYRELVLRGLCNLIPQLEAYVENDKITLPDSDDADCETYVGYYCKTRDNAPLVGPVGNHRRGLFICGAMTGVGVMNSQAVGELLAAHVVNYLGGDETVPLPEYAFAFLMTRYEDPKYLAATKTAGLRSGQL